MPCNSDYMEADRREIEISRVACLLDELDGLPIKKNHWDGYHPLVYNKPDRGNELVAELCEKLRNTDVTRYSLEMQIWWRDHQAADKERLEAELRDATRRQEKEAALAKLTPHERKLLGLK